MNALGEVGQGPIGVLIVENRSQYGEALRDRLGRYPGEITVVGLVDNEAATIEETAKHRPAVVLLDLSIGQFRKDLGESPKHGLSAIRAIRNASPDTRILVMSQYGVNVPAVVVAALQAGIDGYIHKDEELGKLYKNLVARIRQVATGTCVFGREIAQVMDRYKLPGQFTEQEGRVLHLMAEGMTNDQIANATELNLDRIAELKNAMFGKWRQIGEQDALSQFRSDQLAPLL